MSWIKLQSEHDDLDKYQDYHNSIYYYKKDTQIVHNPYGPAIIYRDGTKVYLIESKYHRLDGPARILPNGEGAYYINNKCLTKQEFEIKRLKFLGKEHLMCII